MIFEPILYIQINAVYQVEKQIMLKDYPYS